MLTTKAIERRIAALEASHRPPIIVSVLALTGGELTRITGPGREWLRQPDESEAALWQRVTAKGMTVADGALIALIEHRVTGTQWPNGAA